MPGSEKSRGRAPDRVTDESIKIWPIGLDGTLAMPSHATGIVLFAHGSGSSRLSPRNRFVAEGLNHTSVATMLFDLLTVEEAEDRRNVFDIPLLASRLISAHDWLSEARPDLKGLPIGYLAASTGAAAAMVAAARKANTGAAVVTRGGRPDFALESLAQVEAPTLLIVGGRDFEVLDLNRYALERLNCKKALEIVPGATHLFEEPGTLDIVVDKAAAWFRRHFERAGGDRPCS